MRTSSSSGEFRVAGKSYEKGIASLDNSNALTSNFPDEILAMIFEAGMPGRPERGPEVVDFGATLGSSCLMSRNTGVKSRLSLRSCEPTSSASGVIQTHGKNKKNKNLGERMAIFLSGSRSSSVYIHINGNVCREDRFIPVADFLHLMRGHMGHCQQLRIDGVPQKIMPMLLESCPPAAGHLSYNPSTQWDGPLEFSLLHTRFCVSDNLAITLLQHRR